MEAKSREELQEEIQELRERLEIAEETLRAITEDEVDALVVTGAQGLQIYTLQGADYFYRLFVEEMKEGAATLTADGILLYCNWRLASLLKKPLEQVIGSDFNQYIASPYLPRFQSLLGQARIGVGKGELSLVASDGTKIPVQVTINYLNISTDQKFCSIIVTDLTEQKRNQKIIASERLSRSILDQAAEAIVVCDETGRIIRASQTAHQLCAENLIFKSFSVIFPLEFSSPPEVNRKSSKVEYQNHKPNLAETQFSISTVLEGESFRGVEVVFKRKDGQIFNLLLSARCLFNRVSNLNACVVTLTDITARKQAEIALKQLNETLENRVRERTAELAHQKELLDAFFRSSYVGMTALDNQMRYFMVNQALAQINGVSVADHIGKTPWEIVPDLAPKQEEVLRHVLTTGESVPQFEISGETQKLPGIQRTWLASYFPIRGQNFSPIGIGIVVVEITERKIAEKQLELQAVITRNMPGGICLIRASDWRIVYANPQFERLFGYESGELNEQHITVLNYETLEITAVETATLIIQAIEVNGEATYEVKNVKKDGTPFWSRSTTSKFDHPDYGTVYVAVQYDITEQKQAADIIKSSLKEKEVLLKEIHHRVKNNLQIVSSLLHMQSRRTKDQQVALVLQDSQNRIASIAIVHEKLYRSEDLANIDFAQYVPDLTTHLFDSYNISSNAVKLHLKIKDIFLEIEMAIPCGLIINELVSNSIKYAFTNNQKRDINVESFTSNQLPVSRYQLASTKVEGSLINQTGEVAISQNDPSPPYSDSADVVEESATSLNTQLVTENCSLITVEFYANSDDTLTLIVRDNGIGIPDDFDIETTTSLGLTLVQGLVDQLEGKLELDRTQGTEFKITFPGGKK